LGPYEYTVYIGAAAIRDVVTNFDIRSNDCCFKILCFYIKGWIDGGGGNKRGGTEKKREGGKGEDINTVEAFVLFCISSKSTVIGLMPQG
jgi:hypothetical protein